MQRRIKNKVPFPMLRCSPLFPIDIKRENVPQNSRNLSGDIWEKLNGQKYNSYILF